jgi:hypothetical protein
MSCTFVATGETFKLLLENSTCTQSSNLLDAAKRHNLRVAFRVQMSNTEFQPQRLAIPDFLQKQVPL